MEKKNMVLLTVIAVATLLVAVVGATFAYFTATVTDNFTGSNNNGQTSVNSASNIADTLTFATTDETSGSFTATDVYPGHKEVAEIKVTATGSSEAKVGVAFKYNVEQNDFPDGSLKVSLYKKEDTGITITPNVNLFGCTKTSSNDLGDGKVKLYEQCTDTAEALTGAQLVQNSEQNVQKSGTFEIGRDTIEISDSTKTVYYYVVVEFVNKDSSQSDNQDASQDYAINKKLQGKIEVSAA